MRLRSGVVVSALWLLAACNLIRYSGGTSGDRDASNGSAEEVVIRTTEANPYGGSLVVLWSIPANREGFVTSLGDASRVEVLNATDCQVLATVDPIRGRVTAVIKDD